MSTQPPPLPYESPPAPVIARRRPKSGTVIAWVVILASVAYIVGRNAADKRAESPRASGVADFGFVIASRYAVGVHSLFGALPSAGVNAPGDALLPQVDEAAKTAGEQIAAAIVAGEVAGSAAALKRLDELPSGATADNVNVLRAIYAAGNADELTAPQRDQLVVRYGWYGRLALAHSKSDNDPERRAVLWPARRMAMLLFTASGAGLLALLTGLALLVVAIYLGSTGRLVMAYRPPTAPTGPFLEAFALYLVGMIGLSVLAQRVFGERTISSWFVIVVLPFTVLWPLLRAVSRREFREGLGWHRGRGFWREVGAGIVGYLAGLPVLAAGAVVSLLLQRYSGADASHPIVNELGRGGWRTVQLFLLAALWAPVVEETMFRGAFYHHLRGRLPWPAAAALVALLFAAVHPQGWATIPVLGGIAFSFATIREWRGSIIAPAVAHAINNGVVTLLLVMLLA